MSEPKMQASLPRKRVRGEFKARPPVGNYVGWVEHPIVTAKSGYLWVGNNSYGSMACFCHLSNKHALRALAHQILKAIGDE